MPPFGGDWAPFLLGGKELQHGIWLKGYGKEASIARTWGDMLKGL